MMTLSFLMCIFTAKLMGMQVAADTAVTCADCTTNYKAAAGTECADLKTYLNCLETAAGTKDGCTLSEDDAKKIKAATCTTDFASPCTCLKEFWGRDPTADNECGFLEQYTKCLNKAPDAVCEGGPKASVIMASLVGRSDPKCSTSTSTTATTTTPKGSTPTTSAATTTGNKGSGASSLGLYSTIASFLPFVLTAFRL